MHSLIERLRAALAPDYQVERELGSGGMGRVFLARDVPLDRPVAVKVIRPELATAAAVQRFTREARILASINHTNIVAVHRAGEAAGLFYFVMEYLSGEPLSARLIRGPMATEEVVRMAADVLTALEAAHARDIIHRDLKPSNIFLERSRTVVLDFGLAKAAAIPLSTATAVGVGTPAYMPPEQAAGGSVSARTDVYAAGAVIYEALSGSRWIAMPAIDQADWSKVPPTIAPVLKRALAWSPDGRWPDARSLREALLAAAAARETLTPAADQRRLAAVMFTDMVGYTALMQKDEHAARVACARIRAALDAAIPAHNGQLIQDLGDGSLSIFQSAVEAVFAALEIQRSLQAAPAVPLRIGIHDGEIAVDVTRVSGDAVNVAARIQSLASAGEVLVSGKVYDEIKNQRAFRATFMGRHSLKNVARPVRVYAVAAVSDASTSHVATRGAQTQFLRRLAYASAAALVGVVLAWRLWGSRPDPPPPASAPAPTYYDVAILPLESPGAADTLFGQYISQIAILNLSAEPGLAMPAHIISGALSQREADGEQAGILQGNLRARYIIEGFVSFQGPDAIVQATLQRPGGVQHADIYFRAVPEARALGDSLALRVLRELGKSPPPSVIKDRSWDAVRPLLLGNLAVMRDDWVTAEAHYLTAVERDPTFGLAWWQLAITQKWLPGRAKLDLIRLTAADTVSLLPRDRDLIRADATPLGEARLRAFESVRQRYPGDALATLLLGDELFHRGAFFGQSLASAVSVLLDAAELDNDFSPPLEHATWALIRLGHELEAEEALERFIAAAGPAALGNPAGQPALLRLAFDLRFRHANVDSAAAMLRDLPEVIRVFVARVGLSLGLPEAQRAFGEALFRARGTPTRTRGSGAVAQALAWLALGRATPGLAWLDSASVRLGSEARLQAAEWRLIPRTVGWNIMPDSEIAKARTRLAEGEWSKAQRYRAHWALALDALASGNRADAATWKNRLREASAQLPSTDADGSDAAAYIRLIEAVEAAVREDHRRALSLSESLREYAVQRRIRDPFFRAVLFIQRGAWYAQIDSLHAAEREWLWSENNDIAGWLDGVAEPAEIDWVFDAYSEYRRARAAFAARPGDTRHACTHLARVERMWANAEPPGGQLLSQLRGEVGKCE